MVFVQKIILINIGEFEKRTEQQKVWINIREGVHLRLKNFIMTQFKSFEYYVNSALASFERDQLSFI